MDSGNEIDIIRSDEDVDFIEEIEECEGETEAVLMFRRAKYPRYVLGVTDSFVLGMKFESKEQFKELAATYSVKNNTDIYLYKRDKCREEVKCVNECPFHV